MSPRPPANPLPPPTQPAAKAAWDAANLTSAEIVRRHSARDYAALRWHRHPDIATALRLALGSLAIPLVGPLAGQFARAERAAIAAGTVSPRGRRWLLLARTLAIASTAALVAGAVALAVT